MIGATVGLMKEAYFETVGAINVFESKLIEYNLRLVSASQLPKKFRKDEGGRVATSFS